MTVGHANLHRLLKAVHGKHGIVQRAYWVKSEHPTEQTFAFRNGQRVQTVNQKVIAPVEHVAIYRGLFAGRTASESREAMLAIGKVHTVPTSLPVLGISSSRMISANGMYHVGDRQTSTMQVRIGISDTQSTVAHEYGHFLDHHLFGTGKPGLGSVGTYRRNPEMKQLMTTIYKSPSVKSLVVRHKESKATYAPQGVRVTNYLLMPPELMARAYSQYIALRSGSRQMRNEISHDRAAWAKYGYHAQWPDSEFEPIAREFDAMFRRRGLLRAR